MIFAALALTASLSFSQQKKNKPFYNLGLEQRVEGQSQPELWKIWGSGYLVESDSAEVHDGNFSVRIEPLAQEPDFGGMGQTLPAPPQGKTVVLTGWIKTLNLKDGFGGLVLRLKNAAGEVIAFDNMNSNGITGTTEWTLYSISLPYPEETTEIAIGVVLTGSGTLWVDDFRLLMDGKAVSKY